MAGVRQGDVLRWMNVDDMAKIEVPVMSEWWKMEDSQYAQHGLQKSLGLFHSFLNGRNYFVYEGRTV